MDMQTFILGFALVVIGLIFGRLVQSYYGWLVISFLSAVIGTISMAYLLGHHVGVEAARDVVQKLISRIASTGGNEALSAYHLTGDLPISIDQKAQVGMWPFIVSFLMTVFGWVATFFSGFAHILRIKRAAEIGVKPQEVKVNFKFT